MLIQTIGPGSLFIICCFLCAQLVWHDLNSATFFIVSTSHTFSHKLAMPVLYKIRPSPQRKGLIKKKKNQTQPFTTIFPTAEAFFFVCSRNCMYSNFSRKFMDLTCMSANHCLIYKSISTGIDWILNNWTWSSLSYWFCLINTYWWY